MANNIKQNQKQNQKVVVHIHDKPRRKKTKSRARVKQGDRVMQPIIQNVIPIAPGLPPQGYSQFTNNQTPLPNLPPNPVASTIAVDLHHRNITDVEATNRNAQAQNLSQQIDRDSLTHSIINPNLSDQISSLSSLLKKSLGINAETQTISQQPTLSFVNTENTHIVPNSSEIATNTDFLPQQIHIDTQTEIPREIGRHIDTQTDGPRPRGRPRLHEPQPPYNPSLLGGGRPMELEMIRGFKRPIFNSQPTGIDAIIHQHNVERSWERMLDRQEASSFNVHQNPLFIEPSVITLAAGHPQLQIENIPHDDEAGPSNFPGPLLAAPQSGHGHIIKKPRGG